MLFPISAVPSKPVARAVAREASLGGTATEGLGHEKSIRTPHALTRASPVVTTVVDSSHVEDSRAGVVGQTSSLPRVAAVEGKAFRSGEAGAEAEAEGVEDLTALAERVVVLERRAVEAHERAQSLNKEGRFAGGFLTYPGG